MASFVIEGGHKLHGEIHPQGAKNEVLQILCATLLTSEEVTVNNIPDILDVNNLIQLLREMGVKVSKTGIDSYAFKADTVDLNYLESDDFLKKCSSLRGSVMLVGPLVARFGKALISFEHRCHMVELLISELDEDSIKINLIEQELNKAPTYALDVVKALKSRHSDCDFHLIVGSDIKPDLQKWHKIDELKQEAKFHFVPRNGYENSPYPKVSSSEIRDLAASRKPLIGLPIAIADYISKKKLYTHS